MVPGRKLLDGAARRSSGLKARIQASTKAQGKFQATASVRSLGVAAPTFPGIQLRDTLPAGIAPTAVVSGDFNKDNHADFVIANGMTDDLWIYFGKGDGTFALPRIIPLTKGISPVYLQAADLRKNGTLDLIVAESDTSTIGILLGNGDGTFSHEEVYSLPQPPAALVADDFNHDGKTDVACIMYTLTSDASGVSYIAALAGDGTGKLGTPTITYTHFYSTAWNITSGDVNQDSLPDLLVSGPGLEKSQIFVNSGDGTFTAGQVLVASGAFNLVLDARFGDVNEDGCLDVAIADANSYVWVLPGDCGGNFPNSNIVRMTDSNSAIRLADMNGDGHLDIVTTAVRAGSPIYGDIAGDTTSVAFGDGHGNFTLGRSYVGTGESYSLAIADFNEDGKPDVVTSNTATDTATAYLNDGSGGFGFPQGLFVGLVGVGTLNAPVLSPSFADVNHDNKPDVVLLDEGYYGEYFVAALLNDGTGKFTGPITSDLGIKITDRWLGDYRLGDFRGTGNLDFLGIGLSTAYSGGIDYIIFVPGTGDGSFGPSVVTQVSGAQGALTVSDFNADGKLDFAAFGADSGGNRTLTAFLGNGDGTFRKGGSQVFAGGYDISRVFAGDFNRDGKPDVLVYDTGNGYWTSSSHAWEFLGNGDGTFQTARKLFSPIQPLTLSDVNNDHWMDLVTYDFYWTGETSDVRSPAHFTTYLGQPDGSFTLSSSVAPYSGTPLPVAPFLQSGDPSATSMVADLNGDGRVDEIAFQANSFPSSDVYAQVLMGNGDGSFTPTYDVFPFFKDVSYPKYAHDLDGDGRSDLLELDGNTSSMQVFKGAPAPALQMALEEEQLSRDSSCGWIFPNVSTQSDRTVTLSSSVSGVSLPGSMTIPAGSLAQRFCFILSSGFNWRQVFDVRAQLGSDTAVAYASRSYTVGFTEQLSPQQQQVLHPGQDSQPVTITLTSAEGYSSIARLHCEELPPGASCSFASETLAVSPEGPVSTTVVVHTSPNSRSRGPVVIVADDGVVVKRQAFIVAVEPLFAYESEIWIRTTSPGSAAAGITLLGIPPYEVTCSGLPQGASCTATGEQNPYPSSTSLAVSVTTPANLTAGSYPFTVAVKSGTETKLIQGHLEIGDFTLRAPSPQSDWALAGGTAYPSVYFEKIGTLLGSVTVTCSTSFGGSCTGPQGGATLDSYTHLTITVPSGTAAGQYDINVTATSGSLTHNYVVPFYVVDVNGSFDHSSVTLKNGEHGVITTTVSVTAGFSGALQLSCEVPSELSCLMTPASLQPAPGTPAVSSVIVTPGYWASNKPLQNREGTFGLVCAIFLPVGVGLVALNTRVRRRSIVLTGILVLAFVPFLISCGGPVGANYRPPGPVGNDGRTTSYTVTVKASAGSVTKTLGSATVLVTH